MESILIKNGILYDGLGNPGMIADIFLDRGRIQQIGKISKNINADILIDANGKIVCPGFVDIHRHCDMKPLNDPYFGRCELAQGITTAVVGNCGISPTPCSEDRNRAKEMYDFDEPVLGPISMNAPKTYKAYLETLERKRLPINIAAMIGTGAVRIAVKGFSNTAYTREELKRAQMLVEDALKQGAPGISLGIMYLPECYTTLEEFAYILEPVGQYRRLITTHIRGEGNKLVESVEEVIEIARRAGCALEISHFKSCGKRNWKKSIHVAIDRINTARAKGQDITCDFYPYEGGSTALTTMLPPDFVQGDIKKALARLGTEEGVEEFRQRSRIDSLEWDNFCVLLGWDRIIISGVGLEKFLPMVGMTIEQAARKFGYPDAEALAAALMHEDNGRTAIINMSMCQEDIDTIAKLPWSNVISDAIYAQTDTPHPRMFGAFPKIIREYVKERKIYTLEEGIRRMTSQPALRMGLQGRGILKEGNYADVLVFDPDKFKDQSTYTEPAKLACGLECCIVNGEIAVMQDERKSDVFSGHVIRRKAE